MNIYLDIIFLENLCMNYIILFATCYIMRIETKIWKILISSLIGGLYAVILYMNVLPIYSNIITKIILSIVMVYVSTHPKTPKETIKQLMVFYLISFTFGGCAFSLLYIVKPQNILMKNGVYIGTYPIKITLLGGIVGFIIAHNAFKMVKNKLKKKDMIYEMKVKILEKEINVKAMLDTGNMLKDPITKMPVVVIEKEKLNETLPKELLENIERILGGEKDCYNYELDDEYVNKIKIIPFSSIGKQNGLMIGIKADEITIQGDEFKEYNNVIIGISQQKLSNNYSALFGLDLFEGRENNEFVTNIKK